MSVELNCKRTIDRKRVLMKATLVSADGNQEVRINDVTVSGARITWDRPIANDEDVIFKRGGLFVAARVIWSKRDSAGLEFYRDVSLAELASSFNLAAETA